MGYVLSVSCVVKFSNHPIKLRCNRKSLREDLFYNTVLLDLSCTAVVFLEYRWQPNSL